MDIHKNRGTSIYYYNNNSKALAKILEENLTKELGTRKDGVKTASFAVIRPTDYIGVLLEIAYMTNPIDSVLYTKESFPPSYPHINTPSVEGGGKLCGLCGKPFNIKEISECAKSIGCG